MSFVDKHLNISSHTQVKQIIQKKITIILRTEWAIFLRKKPCQKSEENYRRFVLFCLKYHQDRKNENVNTFSHRPIPLVVNKIMWMFNPVI